MILEFTDEWGQHSHETISGPPYDFNKKVVCVGCLAYLNAKADIYEAKFTEKRNLPADFWTSGYKRMWDND